jgi:hypothetical protein
VKCTFRTYLPSRYAGEVAPGSHSPLASTRRLRFVDKDDEAWPTRLECPKEAELTEVDGRKATTGARAVIDAMFPRAESAQIVLLAGAAWTVLNCQGVATRLCLDVRSGSASRLDRRAGLRREMGGQLGALPLILRYPDSRMEGESNRGLLLDAA